jgi:hypothetical protein
LSGFDERYRKSSSIVSTQVGEGVILVPIRQRAGDLDDVYTLNETAARIWELIDGQRSLSEIRDLLVEEFDVGEDEAKQDVADLIAELEAAGTVGRP